MPVSFRVFFLFGGSENSDTFYVFGSGVPIIDYNRKSVDCWYNPSARLQNFQSD
jgi:hypothetical protein